MKQEEETRKSRVASSGKAENPRQSQEMLDKSSRENESYFPVSPFPIFYVLRITFYTLLIFWLSVVAAAKSPLQIIQASPDTLLIKFEVPTLQFNSQEIHGHPFATISFTGASLTTDVGHPSLPVYPQLIGIPLDDSPLMTVIDSRLEVRQTERVIPAQPSGIAPLPTDAHHRYGLL